ncbi:MAG: PHP domain-containing protein [Erysipelotrichaceae bacterium]|nr:PHP domain-containing protein [Erysipelotrichaceae bacterium]
MKRIDLHIHTNISADGTYSPAEIIEIAKSQNMDMIAIADHNSVRAVKQAVEMGKEKGIRVIGAIEIDCVFESVNFHLTGYGIDVSDERYQQLETFYHDQNVKITWEGTRSFLKAMQLDINDDVLRSLTVQDMIVPEDLAEYLLSHSEYDHLSWLDPYRPGGSRCSNPNLNFYWDYFSQGKIGYVKDEKKSAEDMIDLIHQTKGKAFVAHPVANFKGKDDVLIRLLQKVDGLEVYSTYHTLDEVEKYRAVADSMHLLKSAGSDFHGHHKPAIHLGVIPGLNEKTSEEILKWIEELS